jgi:hypothetical protein
MVRIAAALGSQLADLIEHTPTDETADT